MIAIYKKAKRRNQSKQILIQNRKKQSKFQ